MDKCLLPLLQQAEEQVKQARAKIRGKARGTGGGGRGGGTRRCSLMSTSLTPLDLGVHPRPRGKKEGNRAVVQDPGGRGRGWRVGREGEGAMPGEAGREGEMRVGGCDSLLSLSSMGGSGRAGVEGRRREGAGRRLGTPWSLLA